MRLRTIALLALTALCGIGLGALSFFSDGAYTALCLFAFPVLVALMYLLVVIDIVHPPQAAPKARREAAREKLSATPNIAVTARS